MIFHPRYTLALFKLNKNIIKPNISNFSSQILSKNRTIINYNYLIKKQNNQNNWKFLSTRPSWNYTESPYSVLNIPTSATQKEIKKAYFNEAKKYHPGFSFHFI